jgi:hypothetical protein
MLFKGYYSLSHFLTISYKVSPPFWLNIKTPGNNHQEFIKLVRKF